MITYYLLILIPSIIYIIGKIKNNNYTKISINVFFWGFLLILSLRSINCGTDLKNYYKIFSEIATIPFSLVIKKYGDSQVLFYILNKIVSIINCNFQFYIVLISIISIIPIMILYRHESNNSFFTISLFITVAPFSMFFSGLKQSIAMGIVLISFYFIKKKKIIPFIGIILIAMLFHKSAIYCLVLYPLYYANITKKWLYFIVPTMILIFIFRSQIFELMLNFADPDYIQKYSINESNGAYSVLLLLILFCVYCFFIPDKDKIDINFKGLRNYLLLSTCIQCFASINPIVMRINYYILLFIPLLIPKVKDYCKKENVKNAHVFDIVMSIFLILYFFINAYTGKDILNIFPYIPFWR